MNLQKNGVSKPSAGSGSQGKAAPWIFGGMFVLVLALLFSGVFFHPSSAWQRILKTGIPVLTLVGLLVAFAVKRRNARTVQRMLSEIEQALITPKSESGSPKSK